jgi:hypothetical protein
MAPPSWMWQLQRPTSTTAPTKPQVSETSLLAWHNTHTLQVRRYQCKVGLRRWASRPPGLHPGPFWPMHAHRDTRLLAEDVSKRGEVLGWWRMGRWNHSPLPSIFILLFIVPYLGFRLRGCFLPPVHSLPPGQRCSPVSFASVPIAVR